MKLELERNRNTIFVDNVPQFQLSWRVGVVLKIDGFSLLCVHSIQTLLNP